MRKKTLFFDFGQQKGLFAHTVHQKSWSVQKNAVSLHRQKETKPGDKDNKLIKVGAGGIEKIKN